MHQNELVLIGCGVWGQCILRDLVKLKVRVCVIDQDAGLKQTAMDLGASAFFSTLDAMTEADGVIVATPATSHTAVVEALDSLGNTAPIFVEKPLTHNSESAERLINRTGPPVFVLHTWVYHPGVRKMKSLVGAGTIGSPTQIRTVRVNWTSPRTDVDCIANMAPHDLSIFQYLLGEIPKPIFALGETLNDQLVSCLAVLKSSNDLSCVAELSNRYARKRRELRIHGEEGVLVLPDDSHGYVRHSHGGGVLLAEKSTQIVYSKESALITELKAVLNYLQTGDDAELCDVRLGADVVKGLDEIKRLASLPVQFDNH